MSFLEKVYHIVENPNEDSKIGNIFERFIVILILANVVAIVLESFEEFELEYHIYFRIFEFFSVTIFTIEYSSRVLTVQYRYKDKSYFGALMSYMLSPMAIVDLLAILPFYIPLVDTFDLRFLRLMRLMRLLRVLKLARYSQSHQLVADVLKEKKEELGMTIFVTMVFLLISSALMYFIENDVQPEAFPNIFAAFWWAVATLTTVGYGDVYPVTGWGKFISGIIALLGIGLIAMPTGILSAAFIYRLDADKGDGSDRLSRRFGLKRGEKNHLRMVNLKVKISQINLFKSATELYVQKSNSVKGVLRLEVLQSDDHPEEFVIYQLFKNDTSRSEHYQSETYLNWRNTTKELLQEDAESERYSPLTN